MLNIDPARFRPLGNRVLVRRLALPEQSAGGIFVLGRDYPTVGRIVANSQLGFAESLMPFVQWTIDADYDWREIGPDLILLDFNQINIAIDSSTNQARAVGDRVLVEPLGEWGGHEPLITVLKAQLTTRWSHARVVSVGMGRARPHRGPVCNDVSVGDIVLFQPSALSEIRLAGKIYWIIRNENIVATLEDEQCQESSSN